MKKTERVEETEEQKNARWSKQKAQAKSFARQAGIKIAKPKKEVRLSDIDY